MKKELTPHWIIINWQTRSIWKTPYLSFEEAEKEMNKMKLNRNDWKIEKRESWREVEEGGGGDEFSKF